MMPVGRLIMLQTFGKRRLHDAITRIGIMSLMGILFGPLLGGALTTWLHWRWIFYINIPIGMLALWLINTHLKYDQHLQYHKKKQPPLDWSGFILLGLGMACLLHVFQTMLPSMYSPATKCTAIIISLAFLFLYKVTSTRKKHPLFSHALLQNRAFSYSLGASLIAKIGMAMPIAFIPVWLQNITGMNAIQSGLAIVPCAIGALCARPIIIRLKYLAQDHELLIGTSLFSTMILLCLALLIHGSYLAYPFLLI